VIKNYQKKIKGIFPILYTFFNKDNSIDYKLMEDQINLILKKKSHGIACLGLATEVNKLSFKEKVKIIELVTKVAGSSIPKAITIQSGIYSDYKKLIKIAQSNNADWIILQPLIKNKTTDKDCLEFFNKLLPLCSDTLTGIQNAKEYIGVGLSSLEILKLYNKYTNFRAIKAESSSVIMQKDLLDFPKDLIVFNGRGGQEIIDNLNIGCRGIVPCLDGADKFIKIYNYIRQKKYKQAEKEYKNILPSIIFIMQSIDTLICYGKRICAYRMGIKKIYDRKPFLVPTDYGITKSIKISQHLGKF
tara:strand:+ start:23 stop:928 length:906 start_codon:yes stop_codon:yes gene_type:complete